MRTQCHVGSAASGKKCSKKFSITQDCSSSINFSKKSSIAAIAASIRKKIRHQTGSAETGNVAKFSITQEVWLKQEMQQEIQHQTRGGIKQEMQEEIRSQAGSAASGRSVVGNSPSRRKCSKKFSIMQEVRHQAGNAARISASNRKCNTDFCITHKVHHQAGSATSSRNTGRNSASGRKCGSSRKEFQHQPGSAASGRKYSQRPAGNAARNSGSQLQAEVQSCATTILSFAHLY